MTPSLITRHGMVIAALHIALVGMLKAHGVVSDPECQPVDCDCPACIAARDLIDELESGR